MTKGEQIADWFKSGRNYRKGVALLAAFGVDTYRYLPYLSARMVPPFYTDSLLQDVKKLSAITERPTPITHHPSPIAHIADPDIIADLRHQMKRLYDEMRVRHGEMKVAARTGKETFERPRRILSIFEQIRGIGEHLQKWEKSGVLPPLATVEPIDAAAILEKQKRVDYLNQRISRFRNNPMYEEQLKRLNIEREALRAELAIFTKRQKS